MANLTLRGQCLRAAKGFGQKVGTKVLHVQRAAQVRALLDNHVAARECSGQHARDSCRSLQVSRSPSFLGLLRLLGLLDVARHVFCQGSVISRLEKSSDTMSPSKVKYNEER